MGYTDYVEIDMIFVAPDYIVDVIVKVNGVVVWSKGMVSGEDSL